MWGVTLVLRLSFPRNMLASEVFRLSEICPNTGTLPAPAGPSNSLGGFRREKTSGVEYEIGYLGEAGGPVVEVRVTATEPPTLRSYRIRQRTCSARQAMQPPIQHIFLFSVVVCVPSRHHTTTRGATGIPHRHSHRLRRHALAQAEHHQSPQGHPAAGRRAQLPLGGNGAVRAAERPRPAPV